jgi:hypothetical protein
MFGSQVKSDGRIKSILDSSGLKYQIDSDGDFKVIFCFDDGRTQLAFVNSNTSSFAGVEIRDVWSIGLRGQGQLSSGMANALLLKNQSYKVGGWYVSMSRDATAAIFKAAISANASPAELLSILQAVAVEADEVEKEFLGSDSL